MKDLFLNNKLKGCKLQLEKLERKLLELETKSAITKILMAKHIKRLQEEQKNYQRLYNTLKAQQIGKQNKKMHRVALAQDAFYEVKSGFKNVIDAWMLSNN